MLLKINGYDVSIKVKRENDTQYSKYHTMALLNEISTFCAEASDSYTKEHLIGLSAEARRIFNDISDALDELGAYDDYK